MSKFDEDGDGKLDYEVSASNKIVTLPIVVGIQGTLEQKQEQEEIIKSLFIFENLLEWVHIRPFVSHSDPW